MEIAQSDLTGLLQAHTNLLLQVACSLLSKDVFLCMDVWPLSSSTRGDDADAGFTGT